MNLEQLKQEYDRDGVMRVHEFFNPETLEAVKDGLARYIKNRLAELPPGDFTLESDGKTVRNLWRMEKHDPYFLELASEPRTVELIAALLKDEPVLAGVETFNKPAKVGSGVPPHQDNAYFCRTPPAALTVWIAIDEATLQNGPINYIKESHQLGVLPHRASGVAGNSMGLQKMPEHSEADLFCGTLAPGDALIHHCQTIHWSAVNQTDRPRCGMLMVYRGANSEFDPALKQAYDAALSAAAK
jgi:ectoine hydroxylase-related dioxygenase (phytanoyl-CoA dioxygenase family)